MKVKIIFKKIIIISLVIILCLLTIIYKNNNSYNNNVYFAFYKENEKLESMPEKDNLEDLVFSYGNCNNGASIEWDDEAWAPLVKNLIKSKTKCNIHFRKSSGIEYIKNLAKTSSSLTWDGKKTVGIYGTNDNNLRYIGSNPNNYVLFNNELWRIIGVMKVKTDNNNVEERIKLIRKDGTSGQKDFGQYSWDSKSSGSGSSDNDLGSNDWTDSQLKDMLNGIYLNSEIGDCYKSNPTTVSTKTNCDFTGNGLEPKGLNKESQDMIDSDIKWNLGGCDNTKITVNEMYENERSNNVNSNRPTEWSKANDQKYHNGVGLMYYSDYRYATDGGTIGREKCLSLLLDISEESWYISKYRIECEGNDWLKPNRYEWTLSHNLTYSYRAIYISNTDIGYNLWVSYTLGVQPTIYLKSSIKILSNPNPELEYGTIDNPFQLGYV